MGAWGAGLGKKDRKPRQTPIHPFPAQASRPQAQSIIPYFAANGPNAGGGVR